MRIRFIRNRVSSSLRDLVNSLREDGYNVKMTKIGNSRYTGSNPSDIIINWGCPTSGPINEERINLNKYSAVDLCSNKCLFFSFLWEADREFFSPFLPLWTRHKEVAAEFIQDRCSRVYCRTLSRASQGKGIVVVSDLNSLIDAPLYTCEVDVDREFRVHVFRGKVIDFAQKKKMRSERREQENITLSEEVRNLKNGWIFARENVFLPEGANELAIKVLNTIGLDFGAVDMALDMNGHMKIFEVNSAPGLEGTTLLSYATAIKSYMEESL